MKWNVYVMITSAFSGERKVSEVPLKGNPVEAVCIETLLLDLAANLPANRSLDLTTIGVRIEPAEPHLIGVKSGDGIQLVNSSAPGV